MPALDSGFRPLAGPGMTSRGDHHTPPQFVCPGGVGNGRFCRGGVCGNGRFVSGGGGGMGWLDCGGGGGGGRVMWSSAFFAVSNLVVSFACNATKRSRAALLPTPG